MKAKTQRSKAAPKSLDPDLVQVHINMPQGLHDAVVAYQKQHFYTSLTAAVQQILREKVLSNQSAANTISLNEGPARADQLPKA